MNSKKAIDKPRNFRKLSLEWLIDSESLVCTKEAFVLHHVIPIYGGGKVAEWAKTIIVMEAKMR
ncbi:hypothetical protein AMJ44_09330 [candidate division WOR-1 bacterium DG_54_3]|uniref:HNH endonuclease n=1 Tax=candidate division WOR-1 bacterium DG_54_3 TaxID=1703775 RepID=A0A0S7XTP5_UNCSA|nr:MAG: hypothetical protein AMJ44_09330 [candidate division WOR-1 bacterium DG_54_3]